MGLHLPWEAGTNLGFNKATSSQFSVMHRRKNVNFREEENLCPHTSLSVRSH
jgi:hypothetical protein